MRLMSRSSPIRSDRPMVRGCRRRHGLRQPDGARLMSDPPEHGWVWLFPYLTGERRPNLTEPAEKNDGGIDSPTQPDGGQPPLDLGDVGDAHGPIDVAPSKPCPRGIEYLLCAARLHVE